MIKFDIQKLPNGLVGFKDNVCYANSVLQLLISIPDFRQWCLDNHDKNNNNQILNNLVAFVCCYVNSNSNVDYLWNIHNKLLESIFSGNNIQIKNGVQFDASEFLDLMLENINLNKLVECKTNRTIVVGNKIVATTESRDLVLSLPVMDNCRQINNLKELMIAYQTPEIVDDYKYDGKIVKAEITSTISTTSKYLIIQLRRYSNNRQHLSKMNYHIEIPLIANISKLTNQKNDKIYHLISRINHIGSINNGHYTSDVYSFNRKLQRWCWYHCSDTNITINPELIDYPNETGYIYVYKLIPSIYYSYIFKNISKNL